MLSALDRLGRAPAHFDAAQLDHWQREAVRRLTPEQAVRLARLPNCRPTGPAAERLELAALLRGNLLFPADAAAWLSVLRGELAPLAAGGQRRAIAEAGPPFFEAALAAYRETGADFARSAGS